jgi:hypothetical protein
MNLHADYQEFYNRVADELKWYADEMNSEWASYAAQVPRYREAYNLLAQDREALLEEIAAYFGLDLETVQSHFGGNLL